MCDRHSLTYGYICDRCFDELVLLGPDADVSEFMQSTPTETNHYDSEEKWNKEFPVK